MKKIVLFLLFMILMWGLMSCDDMSGKTSFDLRSEEKDTDRVIQQVLYHTIRFETNGGSIVSAQNIQTLTEAPYTERDGYLFEGWYRDSTFTQAVVYPLSVDTDMTVYAKWLKLRSESNCTQTSIKLGMNSKNTSVYAITPNGFDMDRLEELGFSMRITVDYDVSYSKDYDVLWDIGYLGAPEYDVSILDSRSLGTVQHDVKAPQLPTTREISYTASIADIRKDKLTLTFSTDNIQNSIYFYNIHVTYECVR